MKQSKWVGKFVNERSQNRKNYHQGPKTSLQQWQTYIHLFRRFLAGRQQPVVLVMGSTPELRDLALSYSKARLITVDNSPKAIARMNPLIHHKNNPREKIIISDWLKMQIDSESIDLIVGDCALIHFLPDQFEIFFRKARKILKPNGVIILREPVLVKKLVKSPQAIILQARKEKWHWCDLHAFLYICTKAPWHNFRSERVTMGGLYSWIGQAHKKGILSEREFKALWPWHGSLVHTVLPKEKFIKLFKKYFKPVKVNQPHDLRYQQFMPFFAGQPR